jgi:AcrR family transcriptional regulator
MTLTEQSVPFKSYDGIVSESAGLSGRRAQAARNDEVILEAARTVFLRDPAAPISAVAREADVGISALYRRYAGKEEMLQRLCADGLHRFIAIAESALRERDPWKALGRFLRDIVDSDVHSLTVQLAGTFTPTEELGDLAGRAHSLMAKVLERAQAARVVRTGIEVNDLPMLFEQLAAVRVADPQRTADLRRRYLTLHLEALDARGDEGSLPGSSPTDEELGERWVPGSGRRR